MIKILTLHTAKSGVRLAFEILVLAIVVSLLFGQGAALGQDGSVSAELSASTITRDESVVLTITAIGIDAELDASSLNKDFDVVGNSSSRQISTVIGSNNQAVNTSVVTWALELLPKGEGVFTVPAVKVGSLETQLLSLTVNAVPQGAKRDIFLEASVDNSSPWVQSQVVMTIDVFMAIDIIDGGMDEPAASDLVVERIGEDTQRREVRDGREYSVAVRRFALFPQKSGTITINPVTLSVSVPAQPNRVRGFFSPTRKLTRTTDAIELTVQARPASNTAWWLPARNVTLQTQWQGDPKLAQVDQPLTRTIVMRAEGVQESQLPQISIPAIEGLSLYAEDPKLAMVAADSGLISEQRINWALIPQRSGSLTLPAVTVEWFNTLTGRSEITELPPETIEVTAPSVASSNVSAGNTPDTMSTDGEEQTTGTSDGVTPQLDAQAVNPTLSSSSNDKLLNVNSVAIDERVDALEKSLQWWQWLAIGACALWALTVAAWMMLRKRVSPENVRRRTANHNQSVANKMGDFYQQIAPMSQIDKACKAGDLLEVKSSLLAWSAKQWPTGSPTTLDAIQAKLPQGVARQKIESVQLALYSKHPQSAEKSSAELATFVDDLKAAMHQAGAESGTVDGVGVIANENLQMSKSGSRLPQL